MTALYTPILYSSSSVSGGTANSAYSLVPLPGTLGFQSRKLPFGPPRAIAPEGPKGEALSPLCQECPSNRPNQGWALSRPALLQSRSGVGEPVNAPRCSALRQEPSPSARPTLQAQRAPGLEPSPQRPKLDQNEGGQGRETSQKVAKSRSKSRFPGKKCLQSDVVITTSYVPNNYLC